MSCRKWLAFLWLPVTFTNLYLEAFWRQHWMEYDLVELKRKNRAGQEWQKNKDK